MGQNDRVNVPLIISTVLLLLAVVLVVLTRLRLAKRNEPGAGRLDIPLAVVNAHSIVGGLGILVWGTYLFADADWVVGFIGLVLWWITTVIGLLILLRWLPAKGKHASEGATDEWTEGPWLSMLGHLGALVGAIVWTAFFALDKL
jgi:hypothetical protein